MVLDSTLLRRILAAGSGISCALVLAGGPLHAQSTITRHISPGGTASVQNPSAPAGNATGELDPATSGGDTDSGNDATAFVALNRPLKSNQHSGTVKANGSTRAKSNPEIVNSFDGLNLFQQRYVANNGNQLQLEPPDQGLCAGNGCLSQ